jgi:hypothetical protein
MKFNIRDIIKESLSKEALSASPKATLEELENALIPYHEKLLAQAEKNMKKAESESDTAAHSDALKMYEKELRLLVRLQEKKLELMKQILSQTNKQALDSVQY